MSDIFIKFKLRYTCKKKLGVIIVTNRIGNTVGIITDGDIKRAAQKNKDIKDLKVMQERLAKFDMTKNINDPKKPYKNKFR